MHKAFGDKLIEVTKRHTGEIAKQWSKAVRKNPRTPSYHSADMDRCIVNALEFYINIGLLYFSEKPYKEIHEFFREYAAKQFNEDIPLEKAIYALIMMRRHIWLNAESRAVFAALDQHQAVEGINRTICIFDQAIYIVIQYYEDLKIKQLDTGGKIKRA
ncbi:MAG: hypothetical protein JW884_02705 [Deltaproteobacteria bacterium]|nr:hypothetical protein [Deltaproteobacteria bacterium]